MVKEYRCMHTFRGLSILTVINMRTALRLRRGCVGGMLYFLSVEFPLPSRIAQMLCIIRVLFVNLRIVLLLVSLMFQVHLHLRCIPVPRS